MASATHRADDTSAGHFAHRHIRRTTPLGVELYDLEVPTCQCAYEPPRFAADEDEDDGDWPDRPRSRRSRSWLAVGRLLVAVHGQEGVPDSEPCHHTEEPPAAASDRLMRWWPTLAEWAAMLLEYDPAGHGEPPLDPRGGDWLIEADVRVARYYLRARSGLALRHPDDVLTAGRLGVRGVAGRHDVRALGGGLRGDGPEEEAPQTAAELWAEVRAELEARDRRRGAKEVAA